MDYLPFKYFYDFYAIYLPWISVTCCFQILSIQLRFFCIVFLMNTHSGYLKRLRSICLCKMRTIRAGEYHMSHLIFSLVPPNDTWWLLPFKVTATQSSLSAVFCNATRQKRTCCAPATTCGGVKPDSSGGASNTRVFTIHGVRFWLDSRLRFKCGPNGLLYGTHSALWHCHRGSLARLRASGLSQVNIQVTNFTKSWTITMRRSGKVEKEHFNFMLKLNEWKWIKLIDILCLLHSVDERGSFEEGTKRYVARMWPASGVHSSEAQILPRGTNVEANRITEYTVSERKSVRCIEGCLAVPSRVWAAVPRGFLSSAGLLAFPSLVAAASIQPHLLPGWIDHGIIMGEKEPSSQ